MNEKELILTNQKLIYKCIKDMHLYWNNEDEFQEHYDNGLIGLIQGVRTYDESKDFKLSTYLCVCIKNAIAKGIQLSTNNKRKIHKEKMISLDKEINDISEDTYLDFIADQSVNIEDDFIKKVEIEKIINAINLILSPDQKRIISKNYGINGYKEKTYREIAKEENRSYDAIRGSIYSSTRKLRNFFEKNQHGISSTNRKKKSKVSLSEIELEILNQFEKEEK